MERGDHGQERPHPEIERGLPVGGSSQRLLRERMYETAVAGRFTNPCTAPADKAGLRRRIVDRAMATPMEGLVTQLLGYAQRVDALFAAIAERLERFDRPTSAEEATLRRTISTLEQRTTTLEHAINRLGITEASPHLRRWYSAQRFEDEFRGAADELSERYVDVASRFEGMDPVLDIGCGRGDLVRLLLANGVETRGIDLDGEVIAEAKREGLPVEQGDGIELLRSLPDASLGGVLAVQVVEHLSAQQLLDFVALAADKLRTGGLLFADTPNPQSLYVFTSALYLDPTHTTPIHPAYLAFLYREAGFTDVRLEHRSEVPAETKLPPVSGEDETLVAAVNDVIRQLNELLYGPQDYAVVATR